MIEPGMRVLDFACGSGRHAVAAAERGAVVTGIDADPDRLKKVEEVTLVRNVAIECVCADLETYQIPPSEYDLVMVFNYLDRERMADIRGAVKPGGFLMAETFLEWQRDLGWGPSSEKHLLKHGELLRLAQPFEVLLAREVVEIVGTQPAWLASVLAEHVSE